MHLPGAKHCGGHRRIQPNLAGSDLLFSQQRSGEPSLSRAGLTSIGRQIERTPLCDQTSPRRAPSHSPKMSMDLAFRVSPDAAGRVILSFYSEWKLYIRPTVRRRCPATSTAPSAPTGKQPLTRLPPPCSSASKCAETGLPSSKRPARTSGNTII